MVGGKTLTLTHGVNFLCCQGDGGGCCCCCCLCCCRLCCCGDHHPLALSVSAGVSPSAPPLNLSPPPPFPSSLLLLLLLSSSCSSYSSSSSSFPYSPPLPPHLFLLPTSHRKFTTGSSKTGNSQLEVYNRNFPVLLVLTRSWERDQFVVAD